MWDVDCRKNGSFGRFMRCSLSTKGGDINQSPIVVIDAPAADATDALDFSRVWTQFRYILIQNRCTTYAYL